MPSTDRNANDTDDFFSKAKERAKDPSIPYVDIDEMRSADHLLAVISQRRSGGAITFAVFKEFERDGDVGRTSFIPERLFDKLVAFTNMVPQRIAQLRKQGRLVFPETMAEAARRPR